MCKKLLSLATLTLTFLIFPAALFCQTVTVLHDFGGIDDGYNPSSALLIDSAGNIYGTTFTGGGHGCGRQGCGTVYELSPSAGGYTENILFKDFGDTNGENPLGGLTMDSAGNLYGITQNGGNSDRGVVYELSPGAGGIWTETTVYDFPTAATGTSPNCNLIFDNAGNLYGTTSAGGTGNGGVVFQLTPSAGAWTETVLHNFTPGRYDGNAPCGLILDSAGNLDGVTVFGGTRNYNGAGIVYQLKNSGGTWTETILHTFPISGKNLQTPNGGMLFDSAGNLYISMSRGGRGGAGIVELSPVSGKYVPTPLYSFADLMYPPAPYETLISDSAGNLYTASYNGDDVSCPSFGCGYIYEISPGSPHWTALRLPFTRHGTAGFQPFGGVAPDGKGNFFVANWGGGAHSKGTVIEITP